jgi:hypothetical protein
MEVILDHVHYYSKIVNTETLPSRDQTAVTFAQVFQSSSDPFRGVQLQHMNNTMNGSTNASQPHLEVELLLGFGSSWTSANGKSLLN